MRGRDCNNFKVVLVCCLFKTSRCDVQLPAGCFPRSQISQDHVLTGGLSVCVRELFGVL
jgi:hypothetical protein